jgi:hypothetical protein
MLLRGPIITILDGDGERMMMVMVSAAKAAADVLF